MESFFVRYRNPMLLVALVLVQVIMLASQIGRPSRSTAQTDHPDGHSVRLVRLWTETAISPFERVFHWTGQGIRSTWNNYFALRSARAENLQLKMDLDRLRLEQASLAEDARQGARLQALMNFQHTYMSNTVAAQVIGTSGSDQSRSLFVDKGSDDGIRPEMPVITPDGIVGKVREVYPTTSQVLLINDQTSGAGVLLEKTRVRGVVRGNGYGQLEVMNVMPDERIQPGEVVLSSGGDQIFPRGMPVGTVEKVQPDPAHDPYMEVLVKPAADLSRLEEVLIVTRFSAAPSPFLAADVATSEALAAEQKKAAEVMAEKLPTVKPEEVQANEMATGPDRPHTPPQPIHPDRFTAGETPPAADLKPGGGVPQLTGSENAAGGTDAAAVPKPAVKKKPLPVAEPDVSADGGVAAEAVARPKPPVLRPAKETDASPKPAGQAPAEKATTEKVPAVKAPAAKTPSGAGTDMEPIQ